MFTKNQKMSPESEEYTGAFLPTGDTEVGQKAEDSKLKDEEPFFEYACHKCDQEMQ